MSAQGMPPNLMALFAPRAPLVYQSPPRSKKSKGIRPVYTGISSLVDLFSTEVPERPEPIETPNQRRERKKQEKLDEHQRKQRDLISEYDPVKNDCATKNPYATLFVGRLSYETTEKKLKKEFEMYGPIKRLKVIADFNGKSRGYAFIEYEHEADLKQAYKQGDGKKIDGRRVLVDVERARTVTGWLPRRLGGGKGAARFTESKKKLATRVSMSASQPPSHHSTQSKGTWDQGNQSNYFRRTSTGGFPSSTRGSAGPSGRPSYHNYDSRANTYSRPTVRREEAGGRTTPYTNRRESQGYGHVSSRNQSPSNPSNLPPSSDRPESRYHGPHQEMHTKAQSRDSRRPSPSRGYGSKRYRSSSYDSKR